MEASRVGPSGSKQKGTVNYGIRYSLNLYGNIQLGSTPAYRSNELYGTYLESIHGVLASYLFNEYVKENNINTNDLPVSNIINEILTREDAVIDYLFINNEMKINGISRVDLKQFIRERVNFVCEEMNLPEYLPDTPQSSISDWFFQGVNAISIHDFFVSGTHQYNRNWSMTKLSALPFIKEQSDE